MELEVVEVALESSSNLKLEVVLSNSLFVGSSILSEGLLLVSSNNGEAESDLTKESC